MSKLPKARFNLRLPKSKTPTLIYLTYRWKGRRLVYSTQCSVLPADWDAKSQRPIARRNRKDLWSIKRKLDDISTYCEDIFIESDYGLLDVANFKNKLDAKLGFIEIPMPVEEEPVEKKPTFLEFLWEEFEEMQNTHMPSSTLRGFKLHINILHRFAKHRGVFTYEDIDWNFRLELIDWLTDQNIQLSYGNKTLKVLHNFLERARRKKLHNNTNYKGKGWTVSEKKVRGHRVILTATELQVLADLKLFGIAETARDLFLIGAGTGQRFSDFSKYQPDDFYRTINGIPLLSVISQKTHTPVKIPLNIFPWLIPVLEKHNYQSPKISMQKFNDWIKEICLKAGFKDQVLKVEQYMGRKPRIEKHYTEKYKEVASHTCRRSFATNLYRMGYSLGQIMSITGHATESQLRDYIGIDAEENAEKMALGIMQRQQQGLIIPNTGAKVVNF